MTVNFVTIADEEWINENYPDNQIYKDFESGNVATLFALFWRLMDDESKKIVAQCKLKKWEGLIQTDIETDDPVEKLKYLISGADEILAILKAVFKTNELSQPIPEDTEKKSQKEASL